TAASTIREGVTDVGVAGGRIVAVVDALRYVINQRSGGCGPAAGEGNGQYAIAVGEGCEGLPVRLQVAAADCEPGADGVEAQQVTAHCRPVTLAHQAGPGPVAVAAAQRSQLGIAQAGVAAHVEADGITHVGPGAAVAIE